MLSHVPQLTSAYSPAFHVADGGPFFSTLLPASPCLAQLRFVKTASPGPWWFMPVPPAWPHASTTGAKPGARQGENSKVW